MKIINGKYNTAKVFTENIEEVATEQIKELCNQEFALGSNIRIMPDVHAGAGCVIGTTMTITDKVVPNLVGVDIGCGMHTALLKNLTRKDVDFLRVDKTIHDFIPAGFNIRNDIHSFAQEVKISDLRCKKFVKLEKGMHSIGTLGGGNHFIEMNEDENGRIYIVIHSGSRHLGLQVCNYYQTKAYDTLFLEKKETDIVKVIEDLKSQGKFLEINPTIEKIKEKIRSQIPKHLSYVERELFDDYIHDMKIVQDFAVINRRAMLDEITKNMNYEIDEEFATIHNYIDTESMILRKGAVSAQKGQKLLIPINMRDGSLICIGKGNPDWNNSAPHGAGRLMGRNAAKGRISLEEFKKSMDGIYTTSVSNETLDEAPMAYKPMKEITNNIQDTVDIVAHIKPIYNFKAGEDSGNPWNKKRKRK